MTDRSDGSSDDWDPERYDDDHAFVYDYGADVLDRLDANAGERVLDLGCGTGALTAELHDAGVDVVGLDASAEMIAEARDAHPDCEFVTADARTFSLDDTASEEPLDAVFSNAALHWIPEDDHDAVLQRVHDALAPDGRFVAELGGTGNVDTIRTALTDALRDHGHHPDDPWYFPSIGEYTPRLETHAFEVQYARLFDRPTELGGNGDGDDDGDDGDDEGGDENGGLDSWIRMFGDTFLDGLDDDEIDAVIADVETAVSDELYRNGTWYADYRRLRFVAERD